MNDDWDSLLDPMGEPADKSREADIRAGIGLVLLLAALVIGSWANGWNW